jgi:hypothetical protein
MSSALRTRRAGRAVALLLGLGLAAAACGGGGSAKTAPTTTAGNSRATGPLTASFRGVTADSIRVGIPIIDMKAIQQYVDFTRPDGRTVFQAFVDYYNAHGGINGRKIDPAYKVYSPIGNAEALALCTYFTEDQKVFAVVGAFIDFSGDAQLCIARDHETVHVGVELTQEWIDKAPPGLLVTDAVTPERTITVLMDALKKARTLQGRKTAVLADSETRSRASSVAAQALKEMGVDQGALAVLDIAGADTAQAQAQLDGYLERWKTEKVDALVLVGAKVAAKQFVEKIHSALPRVLLVSDSGSSIETGAQDETAAGRSPNPYEGALAVGGLNSTDGEQIKEPRLQWCIGIWDAAHPTQKVRDPQLVKPDAKGKRDDTYGAVADACTELEVFRIIAERAGPNLTNETWRRAVDTIGRIHIPATAYASFYKGKYDADDGFRLREWDSSIGETGGWKNLTRIYDTYAGPR